MNDSSDPGGLRPLEPAYRTLLRLQALMTLVPVAIAATLVDQLVLAANDLPSGFLTVAGWLLAVIVPVMLPARQYRHLGYTMADDSLRVVRGYMFHTDTVVPFVRVQHIDVGQGPLERWLKVAHVVVHTAGTHNSTVTLPGLLHADAVAIRETIRRSIETDFA